MCRVQRSWISLSAGDGVSRCRGSSSLVSAEVADISRSLLKNPVILQPADFIGRIIEQLGHDIIGVFPEAGSRAPHFARRSGHVPRYADVLSDSDIRVVEPYEEFRAVEVLVVGDVLAVERRECRNPSVLKGASSL